MSLIVTRVHVQARAMAVKQVLVGFYDIPKSVEQPLQLVINPEVHILDRNPNTYNTITHLQVLVSECQCGWGLGWRIILRL